MQHAGIQVYTKMLEYVMQIRSLRQKLENTPVAGAVEDAARAESLMSHNISVFVFPSGKVASLPRGTTAGQVLSSMVCSLLPYLKKLCHSDLIP